MTQRIPRKVFFSLLLVLLWLGFLTEGSHALLGATAGLPGNTLTTGSAGLLVSTAQLPSNDLFATSRPGFDLSVVPGIPDSHYLTLKNNSPSNTPLDLDVSAAPQDLPVDLMNNMSLTFVPVDSVGTSTGSSVTSAMAQIIGQHFSLKYVLPVGASQRFRMDTNIATTANKGGQVGSYDLSFNGTQHYAP